MASELVALAARSMGLPPSRPARNGWGNASPLGKRRLSYRAVNPYCCHCGMRLELVSTVHDTDAGRCCDLCYHHVNRLRREPQGVAFWSAKGLAEELPHTLRGGMKVDAGTVAAIRREFERGGVQQKVLAAKYGIARSTLGAIVRYERRNDA